MKAFKSNKSTRQLHCFADEELIEKIEAHCIRTGIPKSEFLRRACYAALKLVERK